MPIRVALFKTLLLSLLLFPLSSNANPHFPTQQTFGGHTQTLNGIGVRTKAFFSLYTLGLYLKTPSKDPAVLLSGTQPISLRMHVTSGMVTNAKMEKAVREGFIQSVADTTPLQARIDQFIAAFKEPIKQGDIYDFIYTPQNLLIVRNGKDIATITGADFAQGLLSIWIGAKPVQASLKHGLLGQTDEGGY